MAAFTVDPGATGTDAEPLHIAVASAHGRVGRDNPIKRLLLVAVPVHEADKLTAAAEQDVDWQKVEAAGIKQAWYVGIAVVDIGWQYSRTVAVPKNLRLYQPNDIDITPRA